MRQVRAVEGVGVDKDRHGLIEGDAVFLRVGLGLPRVPLEHDFSIYVKSGDAVAVWQPFAVSPMKPPMSIR